MGPLLCYSFGKENLKRCDIRNYSVNDGDTIVFCLGEIDCRCHIAKHVSKILSYEEIINPIVNNYLAAIKIVVDVSGLKLKNVCVFNVVPPVRKSNTEEDVTYPFVGTDEERLSYVRYFNKKLKEKCAENKFVFIDVFDKYADKDGFLIKILSDDRVHILDYKYVEEFIYENKLIDMKNSN